MKASASILLLTLLFSCVFSQTVSVAPFIDFNTTFIALKTKKEFNRELELKARPGFNTSVATLISIDEQNILDVSVAFKQRRNQGEPLIFVSFQAEPIALVENSVINNYVGLGL